MYISIVQTRAGEDPSTGILAVFPLNPAKPAEQLPFGKHYSRFALPNGFRLNQLPGEPGTEESTFLLFFLFSYTKDFYYLNELPESLS